jgi:hypothetical protein
MQGYDVITVDDEKVGSVVGEEGEFLIVEQGAIRKTKHALPREFAHVDEAERQIRMTVSKEIFCDSPKVNGEADRQAIAEHYGLAAGSEAPATEGDGETAPGDPARSAEEQEARSGLTPAAEERARIREGGSDSGKPEESPALLGDRLSGSEEER